MPGYLILSIISTSYLLGLSQLWPTQHHVQKANKGIWPFLPMLRKYTPGKPRLRKEITDRPRKKAEQPKQNPTFPRTQTHRPALSSTIEVYGTVKWLFPEGKPPTRLLYYLDPRARMTSHPLLFHLGSSPPVSAVRDLGSEAGNASFILGPVVRNSGHPLNPGPHPIPCMILMGCCELSSSLPVPTSPFPFQHSCAEICSPTLTVLSSPHPGLLLSWTWL